jgi:nitrogen fixation protein FixH
MNWGTRIVLAFVGFFGVIFTLAYISMSQDISLVADNYYEQELTYEDQIVRLKNTDGLIEKPSVTLTKNKGIAQLNFPEALKGDIYEGSIRFFRPSNAAFDRSFDIRLDEEGKQDFDIRRMSKGLWRIKIFWKAKNREYYTESTLII